MSSQILYQASPNYILRTIAGSSVLVAVGAGVADFRGYVTMNATAASMWKVLKSPVTEEEIVDALFDEFEVSKEVLAADIHELLEKLCAKKMVIKSNE